MGKFLDGFEKELNWRLFKKLDEIMREREFEDTLRAQVKKDVQRIMTTWDTGKITERFQSSLNDYVSRSLLDSYEPQGFVIGQRRSVGKTHTMNYWASVLGADHSKKAAEEVKKDKDFTAAAARELAVKNDKSKERQETLDAIFEMVKKEAGAGKYQLMLFYDYSLVNSPGTRVSCDTDFYFRALEALGYTVSLSLPREKFHILIKW